jgi:gluconolactonase
MKPRVIAQGLVFPEGPAFDRAGNLYVVELRAGRISRIPPDGPVRPFAQPGGSPNGAAFGPDGALYVCNAGERSESSGRPDGRSGRIERVAPDGRVEVIARADDVGPLASPNDLVFDRHGGAYFTDPAWEGVVGNWTPGNVCYLAANGAVRRLHSGLSFPNGLGITPDGRSLVVAESIGGKLHAFEIRAPGQLGPPRLYSSLGADAVPDGMAFDAAGFALVAGHSNGKLFVVPPGGGNPVQALELEDPGVTNVCFGGPDLRTLYVTEADLGRVVALEWERPGLQLHPDRTR